MTDVIYDSLSMAVDMVLSAAILAGIVVILRSSTILANYSANQQATAARMNYYREYNMYDRTERLSCADAISAIMYYRYDIEVVIWLSDGTYYYNNKDTGKLYKGLSGASEAEITYENLKSDLGSSMFFTSLISENGSGVTSDNGYTGGVITGIVLRQQVITE